MMILNEAYSAEPGEMFVANTSTAGMLQSSAGDVHVSFKMTLVAKTSGEWLQCWQVAWKL